MENPEIRIGIYGQLLCDKGVKNIQSWSVVFSVKGAGKTDSLVQKSNPTSSHTEGSIQKWVKDLNVRSETMKLWGKKHI